MAVVQISRIQVRRGKKGVDNLPQLASGELGWAIDTQEFYIGNGSVSEGAPAVGNTKILTEHDNIIALAGTYTYKENIAISTGINPTQPTRRSLQSKLDDIVDGRDFGIKGDGVTDDTVALQRALDQLYLNTNKNNANARVTLNLAAGDYKLTGTIFIPPFACLCGAGTDKTIFTTSATKGFTFVNTSSVKGGPYNQNTNISYNNQGRQVRLEGFSVVHTANGSLFEVDSLRDSEFVNLKLTGPWTSGAALNTDQKAFELKGYSQAVMSNNNTFDNVEVRNFTYPWYSDYDIKNTVINNCDVHTCVYGVVLGENTSIGSLGQEFGPRYMRITNCTFDEIARQAIWAQLGKDIQSSNNTFYSVGNNSGTESNSLYSIIKFGQVGNSSNNDFFKRFELLSYDQNYITSQKFAPIVEGPGIVDLNHSDTLEIVYQAVPNRFFKLPGDASTGYEIQYSYQSSNYEAKRSGKLHVVLDATNENLQVRDEYDFAGNSALTTNLQFTANYVDENSDTVKDTIEVLVQNTTVSDTGTFTFKVISKR
jgi:hypothetical protein